MQELLLEIHQILHDQELPDAQKFENISKLVNNAEVKKLKAYKRAAKTSYKSLQRTYNDLVNSIETGGQLIKQNTLIARKERFDEALRKVVTSKTHNGAKMIAAVALNPDLDALTEQEKMKKINEVLGK